jgi:hypothetical protein
MGIKRAMRFNPRVAASFLVAVLAVVAFVVVAFGTEARSVVSGRTAAYVTGGVFLALGLVLLGLAARAGDRRRLRLGLVVAALVSLGTGGYVAYTRWQDRAVMTWLRWLLAGAVLAAVLPVSTMAAVEERAEAGPEPKGDAGDADFGVAAEAEAQPAAETKAAADFLKIPLNFPCSQRALGQYQTKFCDNVPQIFREWGMVPNILKHENATDKLYAEKLYAELIQSVRGSFNTLTPFYTKFFVNAYSLNILNSKIRESPLLVCLVDMFQTSIQEFENRVMKTLRETGVQINRANEHEQPIILEKTPTQITLAKTCAYRQIVFDTDYPEWKDSGTIKYTVTIPHFESPAFDYDPNDFENILELIKREIVTQDVSIVLDISGLNGDLRDVASQAATTVRDDIYTPKEYIETNVEDARVRESGGQESETKEE